MMWSRLASTALVGACALCGVLARPIGDTADDATTTTTATTNPPFTADLVISTCDSSGCTPTTKRIALDNEAYAYSPSGDALVITDGDTVSLVYDKTNGGPRVYLIEEEGVNSNYLFDLVGKEFTFDVTMHNLRCGFNAALYFVGMTANEGGAQQGTNYCDAQAVDGVFCSEMDILEGNYFANQYTTHACIDECASYSTSSACKGGQSNVCDQSGCGVNPYRYGPGTTYTTETSNADFFGPSSAYTIDSTQTVTMVTRFNADSEGTLTSISRYYVQNGQTIDLPTLYVTPPTEGTEMGPMDNPKINQTYCDDIYATSTVASDTTAQMGNNMANGMVLAMSVWYDAETYADGLPAGGAEQTGMSWLDGVNDFSGKVVDAGPCDADTSDDGGPYYATFANIRLGDIGTTLIPGAPTAPTPDRKSVV